MKFAAFPGPGESQTQAQLPLCSSVQLKACSASQLMDLFSWALLSPPRLKEIFLLCIWRAHRDAPNRDESMQLRRLNHSQSKSHHACAALLQEWHLPIEWNADNCGNNRCSPLKKHKFSLFYAPQRDYVVNE